MGSDAKPPRVRIQHAPFDLGDEARALAAGDTDIGAVASFVGLVRGHDDGPLATLELEHYPGMTERAIEAMVDEAVARFALRAARVVHRVGPLAPGEPIVLVLTASAHRAHALDACAFLMDYLKTQAPFWKKETHVDGRSAWVDARVEDDAALARWGIDARNAAPASTGGAS